ncbi:MAG: response regulator transcription factor, partial [Acetobacteraceae bacterium]
MIEDDLTTARGVAKILSASAMVVDVADNGEDGLDLAKVYDYDLVMLDLMLPDMEGYEVVRRLRAARKDTPVLILSGVGKPQAKVKGFSLGADDFLVKPFDAQELVARVQAIVRRSKGFARSVLTVGSLSLDHAAREVSVDGRPVHLTGKEYA